MASVSNAKPYSIIAASAHQKRPVLPVYPTNFISRTANVYPALPLTETALNANPKTSAPNAYPHNTTSTNKDDVPAAPIRQAASHAHPKITVNHASTRSISCRISNVLHAHPGWMSVLSVVMDRLVLLAARIGIPPMASVCPVRPTSSIAISAMMILLIASSAKKDTTN